MVAVSMFKKNVITSKEQELFVLLEKEISNILHKKPDVVEATICAILSSGHLLLEDVPGVGKTTFIKALSKLLDLEVSRIQFTSDLLPSDILGVEVFDSSSNSFKFHRGPIFANVVLADELNRASSRTQSALLEAMGEGVVTVDRTTYVLPQPFIIFASQNPNDNIGTYDIPESQLDRFSAKISLGYPDSDQERSIFQQSEIDPIARVPEKVIDRDSLVSVQNRLDHVHISDEVAHYVKKIVDESRSSDETKQGISTRGGVIWVRMARARALISGRAYVIPDDLQSLAACCLSHRIVVRSGVSANTVIQNILQKISVH